MNLERTIDFPGPEEELEDLLSSAGRIFGGWGGRDRKTRDHVLVFGHFLSLNPNSVRWRARVRREGTRLLLRAETLTFPWTRAKHERIASFRLTQIADYLESRLRGGRQSGRFEDPAVRLPFSTAGRGIASVTAAWTWLIASSLSAGIFAWIGMVLGGLILMEKVAADLAARSELVASLGGIGLPSASEVASFDFSLRLGCAASLAFPIGFLIGSFYALIQIGGEFWVRLSRAAWVPFVFFIVLLLLALVPLLPLHSAVGIALLVPTLTHVGYSLVWGRKKERRRELVSSKGRGFLALLAGGFLAGAVLFAVVPRPRAGGEVTEGMAAFRDRYLLPQPVGRALSLLYYRTTLYAAEPLKDFYDPGEQGYSRQLRVALLAGKDPRIEARLRKMNFAVDHCTSDEVEGRRRRNGYDLVVLPGSDLRLEGRKGEGSRHLPAGADFSRAAREVSRESFSGDWLRELSRLGWLAVFYLGPVALLSSLLLLLLPLVSLLFRALSPKAAAITMGSLFVLSGAGIVLVVTGREETLDALRRIRETDPKKAGSAEGLLPFLRDRTSNVRFEAVYRLYWCVQENGNRRPEYFAPLVATLRDPETRVRLWGCGALGKLGDRRAVPALLRALRDDEVFVRYRAAEALGNLKAKEAIPALTRMCREDWWYCGMYALQALRKIAPGDY